jgi:replicative DNA helicase
MSERHARPLSDSFDAALKSSESAARSGGLAGLSTGFRTIDRLTGGMGPEQLWTIGGVTGSGKSALALCVARAVAAAGHHVFLASLEMDSVSLVHRLASMRTGLDGLRIATWNLSADERSRHIEALNQEKPIAEHIHVDERSRLTIDDIRAELDGLALGGAVALAIVDYVQLVTPVSRQGTREREVGEAVRGLKSLAQDHRIPIIGCSQLSRAADGTSEPSLSHLRESGEIEHASDVVILIGPSSDGEAHMQLAKCRRGPRVKFELSWTPECTRFADTRMTS